jgi:hypothetical protein
MGVDRRDQAADIDFGGTARDYQFPQPDPNGAELRADVVRFIVGASNSSMR